MIPSAVQVTDALGACLPYLVVVEQLRHVSQPVRQGLQQLANFADGIVGQILGEAPRPDVGVVHAQSGDQFEHVENEFALAKPEEHRRHRTQFHPAGGERDEVRGDAVQFHQQDAHHGRAFRYVVGDVEQLLDAEAVGGFVEER